jgi:hypothetical protein
MNTYKNNNMAKKNKKKDQDNLMLWVLAGLGIYWYFKNKQVSPAVVAPVNTVAPDTSMVQTQVQSADYNIKYVINGIRKKIGIVPNTI